MSVKTSPEREAANMVPAVEKAISIFELLKLNENGLSLTDISKKLKFPISSTFRILLTLKHYGYIEQENDKGCFTLGPRILSLANTAKNKLNLSKIALPSMELFTAETNMSCKLGVLRDDELLVISAVNAKKEMGISTEVGSRYPLHAGAASKVILANLPKEKREQIIEAGLKKYTSTTITDPKKLKKELTIIQRQGFSEDNEEYIEGIKALACPVYNHLDEVIAALSVPYLATKSNDERRQEFLARLLTCACEISKALGHSASFDLD